LAVGIDVTTGTLLPGIFIKLCGDVNNGLNAPMNTGIEERPGFMGLGRAAPRGSNPVRCYDLVNFWLEHRASPVILGLTG
jgi:hypothetical protein